MKHIKLHGSIPGFNTKNIEVENVNIDDLHGAPDGTIAIIRLLIDKKLSVEAVFLMFVEDNFTLRFHESFGIPNTKLLLEVTIKVMTAYYDKVHPADAEPLPLVHIADIKDGVDKEIPTLAVFDIGHFPSGGKYAQVWCPFCNKPHTHSVPIGKNEHRVAHCHDTPNSPFRNTGYYLRVGPWTFDRTQYKKVKRWS